MDCIFEKPGAFSQVCREEKKDISEGDFGAKKKARDLGQRQP